MPTLRTHARITSRHTSARRLGCHERLEEGQEDVPKHGLHVGSEVRGIDVLVHLGCEDHVREVRDGGVTRRGMHTDAWLCECRHEGQPVLGPRRGGHHRGDLCPDARESLEGGRARGVHSRHPIAELALLGQGTARCVVFAVPHRAIRVRQRLAYELDEGRVRHGLDVLRHHVHDKLQRCTRRRRPAHACIRRHQMQKRSPLVVRDRWHAALDDSGEARQERGTYGGMQGTRHAAQGI